MLKYHYSVSLRLFHPSRDLESASTTFGLKPTNTWRAGEKRLSRDGEALGGVRDTSYWTAQMFKGDSRQLSAGAALEEAAASLESHKDFLQEFDESGGTAELFVGWFLDQFNIGDLISWRLSQRLADLRLNLAFDIYSSNGD